MKVQKFEGLPMTHQVFNSHSNNSSFNKKNSSKVFFDMDSVDGAMSTDSLTDPILPQLVRKFKKAYGYAFPEKVVNRAGEIKNQIDSLVDNHTFQAIA